ncbi:hypothetical protein D3C71_1564750 [compost metagenome]
MAKEQDGDDGQRQSAQHPVQRRAFQPGHFQAPVGNEHARQRVVRLARAGHVFGDQRIPEEQLQQERHVAHHLDVDRGDFLDEPILRQPSDADEDTQDRRRDQRQQAHAQRVQHAHEDGAAIGVGGAVGDHGFADGEARLAMQEAEAGGDIAQRKVMQRVVHQEPDARADDRQRQDLVGQRAGGRVVPG